MRRSILVGLTCVVGLGFVACASPEEPPSPTASNPSADTDVTPTSVGLPDLDQFTPAPSGVIDEDTRETIVPQPVPTWDAQSRAAATQAAEHALRMFAQPRLDYETWWSQLEPLMTYEAAVEYAYVDPLNIPVSRVTGPGVIINDQSAYVAIVEIPTDVGLYEIIVSRQSADALWFVSRITPVGESHG